MKLIGIQTNSADDDEAALTGTCEVKHHFKTYG